MSIFVSILGLAFLILVHEAGHFFVARGVGMNPRKFYLGFPPAVAKTTRNGIEYGVGAIPLGGYVKIPGMHRPAGGDLDVHFGRAIEEAPPLGRPVGDLRRHLDENDYDGATGALERVRAALPEASVSPLALRSAERGLTEIGDSLAPDAYWRAKTWKRVAVIFAGPAANLLLAVAIFAALFMALERHLPARLRAPRHERQRQRDRQPRARGLPGGSGGRPGRRHDRRDRRRSRVDGDTIRPTIQDSEGAPIQLTVERDGETIQLQPVRPEQSEEFGFLGAIGESFRVTWEVTKEIGRSVGRLVTGDGGDVSSPVGIVQGSSEAVEQGTENYLWVLGLISLSLALLNLLPLLPLDGGHIAFSIAEGIRGRAVAREVYERVSVVGIAVVLLLFFIGLSNDIGRLGD